jgi:hypothetical protein
MLQKKVSRIGLLAAMVCISACGSQSVVSQPTPTLTTFHVTDAAAHVLPGVSVCSGSICATTSATGDAALALPIGVQAFVSFTVPNQQNTFGNLYMPTGQTVAVVLTLQTARNATGANEGAVTC